jgi:hypothetical protein
MLHAVVHYVVPFCLALCFQVKANMVTDLQRNTRYWGTVVIFKLALLGPISCESMKPACYSRPTVPCCISTAVFQQLGNGNHTATNPIIQMSSV